MPPVVAAKGYIANTDWDWYTHFLHRAQPPEEVNFWQPSAHGFRAVPPGAPFFFRLKHPHNAIAGFGFFSRYEAIPAWLAWESFGDLNGAASLEEMLRRLEKYRRSRSPTAATGARPGDYIVGCIMVSQPAFFPPDEWVRDDGDWKPTIVAGKSIDLLHGEGQRILRDCLARQRARGEAVETLRVELSRHGRPVLVEPRLGQGAFRVAVTKAYRGACAVTGEHSLPALEAAHVRPWSDGGPHSVRNGLLLRADVHRLYDKGYVTVGPDYRFVVSPRLVEDFDNGREYRRYHGERIHLPGRREDRPDPALLEWHAQEVFRG